MPISLGTTVDSEIEALERAPQSRSTFASGTVTLLRAALHSMSNVFGTAASRDAGAQAGQVAVLEGTTGQPGTFNPAVLPDASETAKGAVERASFDEHASLSTTDQTKMPTLAGVARMVGLGVAEIPDSDTTFRHVFTVNRDEDPPVVRYSFTPPRGTLLIRGYAIGGGTGHNQHVNSGRRFATAGAAEVAILVTSPPRVLTVNVGVRGFIEGETVPGNSVGRYDGTDTTIFQGSINKATVARGRAFQIGGPDRIYTNFSNDEAMYNGFNIDATGDSILHDYGAIPKLGLGWNQGREGPLGTRPGGFAEDGIVVLYGLRYRLPTLTVT